MHEGTIGAESASASWHGRLLRVTTALYRVTGLLSDAEPMRTVLRKNANDVLMQCIAASRGISPGNAELETRIETLLGLLAVARALPDVRAENFAVLEREYRTAVAALVRETKARGNGRRGERETESGEALHDAPAPVAGEKDAVAPMRPTSDSAPKAKAANERRRAILERLSQTPRVKVSDFYEIFRDVSPKTIQRDLQDMVSQNVIRKEGEKRWTVYLLADVS